MNADEQNENTAPKTTQFRRSLRSSVEKLNANARGYAEKHSSSEMWGAVFVNFILVHQVLTQTVPSPCGSRTVIRSPWGKEAAVAVW